MTQTLSTEEAIAAGILAAASANMLRRTPEQTAKAILRFLDRTEGIPTDHDIRGACHGIILGVY